MRTHGVQDQSQRPIILTGQITRCAIAEQKGFMRACVRARATSHYPDCFNA